MLHTLRFALLPLLLVACASETTEETALDLTNAAAVRSVTVGYYASCAIRGDELYCWGERAKAPKKLPMANGKVPEAIALGSEYLCVMTKDQTVQCFGSMREPTPTAKDMGLQGVRALYEGGDYGKFCAVLEDGSTYCWNSREYDGNVEPQRVGLSPNPKKVIISTVEAYSSVSSFSVCALTASDGVECIQNPDWRKPAEVMAGLESGVTSLDGEQDMGCAAVKGASKCWGHGVPGPLQGLSGTFTKVAFRAFSNSVYALTSTGEVVWLDGRGQAQVRAQLSGKAVDLTTGDAGVCATLENGSIECLDLDLYYVEGAPKKNKSGHVFPGLTQNVSSLSVGANLICGVVGKRLRCVGGSDTGPLTVGHPTKIVSNTVIEVL